MKENKNNKQENQEETPIYLTGDSTLQTPEEDRRDSSQGAKQDMAMEPSKDDLHETNADRFAGSDRAGTAERKDNDMDPSNNDD